MEVEFDIYGFCGRFASNLEEKQRNMDSRGPTN